MLFNIGTGTINETVDLPITLKQYMENSNNPLITEAVTKVFKTKMESGIPEKFGLITIIGPIGYNNADFESVFITAPYLADAGFHELASELVKLANSMKEKK